MAFWAGVCTGILIGWSVTVIVIALLMERKLREMTTGNNIAQEGGGWHGQFHAKEIHDPRL